MGEIVKSLSDKEPVSITVYIPYNSTIKGQELERWFSRTLAAPAEDLDSVLRTQMVAHNHL